MDLTSFLFGQGSIDGVPILTAWIQLAIMAAAALGSMASKAAKNRAAARTQQAGYNLDRDALSTQQWQAQQNQYLQSLLGRSREGLDRAGLQERGTMDRAGLRETGTMNRAALQERGLMDRADLDLNRRKFQVDAPGKRAANSVRGSILANAQDVTASHPRANIVNFQGGLRPSMFSADTRALGSELTRQALLQQMQGDKFEDVPMTEVPDVMVPDATQLPDPTDWDSARLEPPGLTDAPQSNGWDTFLNAVGTIGSLAGSAGSLAGGGGEGGYDESRGGASYGAAAQAGNSSFLDQWMRRQPNWTEYRGGRTS